MISFIAQRIAKAIVVLLALVVLNFFLIRMAPGDPALVMAGEAGAGDQVFLAQLREKFGLDQPLPVQLFLYVKGILSLDLGFSFRQQMPVATLILQRLPATLLLTGTAFAISLAFGILFGALAARFAGTWADTAITVLALVFYATPLFWVALMAILLFSVAVDWLPSFGYETVGANYTGLAHVLDVAAHLVLPATLLLTGTAFAISLAFGILFGALAARFAGTWADTAITVAALIFYATPLFWVALMAILLFSVAVDWLPSFGYETVGANYTGLAHVLDVAAHLILPATTIGLFFMATYARMTRASMLEVVRLDFVKTARAKGLSDTVIQRRHVLRNALLPVVTLAGLQAGTLVGGAVLTETVFAWPGIGRLMYEALLQRDYNLLLGVFVVCSAMVLAFNLITDLVYRSVDPRIEFAS